MRHKDLKRMETIKEFLEQFYFENGRSPSTTEIGKAVGIARGTAYRYLVEMDERGIIQYDGKAILTEKIQRLSPQKSAVVYDGAISCGPLDQVEASIAEYVLLPTAIFGDGELYIIRTTVDSMIGVGIEAGDLVVVKKQAEASLGDIVVALHEGANTLKRLGYDREKDSYVLKPENESMDPIYVKDLDIQGVAKFVIKAL